MQRQSDDNPVTEDDVNEIKGEINSMRYELLDVLDRNGLDVSAADTKSKTVLGKKMKVWERRLLKDFRLAPVATEDEMDYLMNEPPPDEDPLSKFKRIAKLAVLTSAQQKWGQIIRGACTASQIGHCNSREAFKNQQCLQKAMSEAKKLLSRSPKGMSRASSPSLVSLSDVTGSHIMDILNDITKDTANIDEKKSNGKGSGGGGNTATNLLLAASNRKTSKSPSPRLAPKMQSVDVPAKSVSKPVTPVRPKPMPTLSVDPPVAKEPKSPVKQPSTESKPVPPDSLNLKTAASPRHSCLKQPAPEVPPKTKSGPESPSERSMTTTTPIESAAPLGPSPRKTVSICSPSKKTYSPLKRAKAPQTPTSPAKSPKGLGASSPKTTQQAPPPYSSPTNSNNTFSQFTSSQDCLIPPDSLEERASAVRSRPTSPRFKPKNNWL
ncbi:transient receptor [Nesidiocoris tenuis]|uniref:Transient receptor n=2 Tax=Nesidiocoris tenuis TaxID=355587 RepID=A0ABN7AKQ7_9HEMI|nr:transient receptor [Nesidiocoris tenuis]